MSLIDLLKTNASRLLKKQASTKKKRKRNRQSHVTLSPESMEPRVLMTANAVNDGGWNDPGTWENGVLPDANTPAIISHGVTVELDGTDHVAQTVAVHGSLIVPEEAGTADPTQVEDGRMKLYFNGGLVGDAPASQLWNHSDMTGIGGVTGQTRTHKGFQRTGNFFEGQIDKVATYNRALGISEVDTISSSDRSKADGVAEEDMATLWMFDPTGTNRTLDTAPLDQRTDNGLLVGDATAEGELSLDGDGDYVKVGRSTDINRGVFTEKSISLWFKADSTDGLQTLYEQGGGTRGLHVYLDGDTLYAGGWNLPKRESGWQGDWITQPGIVAGEWNHVILTLDGDKGPETDRTLSTRWMHVNGGGAFIVGSETDRYDEGTFTLELTGTDKDHDPIVPMRMPNGMVMQMQMQNNDGFLMTAGGGRVQFYGEEKLSFTKLDATAEVGAESIVVANVIERNFSTGMTKSAEDDGAVNWEAGDEIVIASTSYDYTEEEVRTITGVTDNGDGTTTLAFDEALGFRHYGQIETYREDTGVEGGSLQFDMRAEVALLSRNITIKGLESQDTDIQFGDRGLLDTEVRDAGVGGLSEAEKAKLPEQQVANGVGGHVMFMPGSGYIIVDGVQLDGLGQSSRKGRYPIHWHLGGDRTGDVFRNSSVTNSNNRGVTIHGTNNLTIEGVVVHDVHGHGFFFEDAVETGNELVGNLVLGVHAVGGQDDAFFAPGKKDPFVVDTHDSVQENRSRFSSSAAFWITNPNNTFVGNIAAGAGDQRTEEWAEPDKGVAAGTGFWYAIPRTAIGESSLNEAFENYHPILEDFGTFDFNTSHTTAVGLNFDRGSDIEDANFNTGIDFNAIHPANEYKPLTPIDPSDPDSERIQKQHFVNDFTNYKASEAAAYHRGEKNSILYSNMRVADSYNGPWAVSETQFIDSLYVGHSSGNSPDKTVEVGGPRLYDGAGRHERAHFAGFTEDAASTFQVEGSSFGPTMYHVFPNVSFEGSYDNIAHAISDFSSQDPDRGHNLRAPQEWLKAAIDVDGTLTGPAGGGVGYSIVPNVDFLVDENDVQPEGWDAFLTDDIYARVRVENLDDGSDVNLFPGNAEDPFILFTSQDGDQLEVTSGQNLGNGSWTQVVAKADDEGLVEDDFIVEFGINGVPEGGFVLNMDNQDGGWVRENPDIAQRIDAARLVIKVPSASNYTPEGVEEVTSLADLRSERSNNVFFRDVAGGNLYLNTDITASQGKIKFAKTGDALQTPTELRTANFGTVIEAEDFDGGVDGVSFHDSDGVVDVADGKVVGIADGEWLEYTAAVESGAYEIGLKVASNEAGGQVRVLAANDNSAGYFRELGTLDVPDTEGVLSTEWFDEAIDLAFAEGSDSVFRLEFMGGDFEVDALLFGSPEQSSYLGKERTISATEDVTIKLPEYDEGGEGVAYSDTTPTNDASSTYRPGEGVDATPGLITNNVIAGEWLEFTTNVEAGNYNITLNKAWGGGKVRLLIGLSNSATSFRDLGTFSFGQEGVADDLTFEDVDFQGEWTGSDLVIRVEILDGFMGLNDVQFTPVN